MKVAVVHDYFTQSGGAEEVASQLYAIFPDPDLFSAVALPHCMPSGLKDMPVQTSWMQHLPWLDRYYREYFLLYPLGIESIDLSAYDVVVSSSSGYGKGVRARRDAVHICYCHTPMRWAWNFEQYSARESMSFVKRRLLSVLVGALRRWDLTASREPDHFVANSRTVAARILHAYGRHAEVIHPPINIRRFRPSTGNDDYYLVLARLVSYKRIDLAIQACNLTGRKLLIIGDGPDRKRLEQLAGRDRYVRRPPERPGGGTSCCQMPGADFSRRGRLRDGASGGCRSGAAGHRVPRRRSHGDHPGRRYGSVL